MQRINKFRYINNLIKNPVQLNKINAIFNKHNNRVISILNNQIKTHHWIASRSLRLESLRNKHDIKKSVSKFNKQFLHSNEINKNCIALSDQTFNFCENYKNNDMKSNKKNEDNDMESNIKNVKDIQINYINHLILECLIFIFRAVCSCILTLIIFYIIIGFVEWTSP